MNKFLLFLYYEICIIIVCVGLSSWTLRYFCYEHNVGPLHVHNKPILLYIADLTSQVRKAGVGHHV